ncbi:DUF1748-domain-containing protein [Stereum hirsutum FP-91666 SS1]|uniref:DUF1748-domain-containing protein n=1 Tax=Stereum hirsutum (strain FP-91666) TaxID=721885 RepID=UPI000440CECA|nr:DUF1748-domain-containing protein [Stereum hirsutum FP-91666 SS1]EIM91418.1 DUF1748-domain-containing protein [Stereum hirsutum FP-91666 SS1]
MALGRLVHYTIDAALLSTLLAGVRRSSGFTPRTDNITEPSIRSAVEKYLGFGESVFDMVQGTAVNSSYFKRDS